MTAKTKELHFEDAIEHGLLERGWVKGQARDFDAERGFQPGDFLAFVKTSQPALYVELEKQHGASFTTSLVDQLGKALDSRGTLDVLRHGFKFYGKKIECAYFKPAHGLNPDILARYQQNRLVVTRQVRFVPDGDESVDVLLSLNGLPVATAELKNPLTHQTVEHAISQYRQRDVRAPLFWFKKRALVHFAVDPDLVYMTTQLAGEATRFLPFNRGADGGAGNPQHPSGYRTAYLWEEVWQRDSFLDIVGRFAPPQGGDARRRTDDRARGRRLPALPPARRGAAARRSRTQRRSGDELSHPAFGRVGQVELHRLARAPSRVAA